MSKQEFAFILRVTVELDQAVKREQPTMGISPVQEYDFTPPAAILAPPGTKIDHHFPNRRTATEITEPTIEVSPEAINNAVRIATGKKPLSQKQIDAIKRATDARLKKHAAKRAAGESTLSPAQLERNRKAAEGAKAFHAAKRLAKQQQEEPAAIVPSSVAHLWDEIVTAYRKGQIFITGDAMAKADLGLEQARTLLKQLEKLGQIELVTYASGHLAEWRRTK